jgi:hypothetical protein
MSSESEKRSVASKTNKAWFSALCAAWLSLGAPAKAQEPGTAPPEQALPPPPPPRGSGASAPEVPAPEIRVETPPLPPVQGRRGYHVHDGFYWRLGLGLGTAHAFVSPDKSSIADYSLQGGSLLVQALVGGTPARGLVIGGMIMGGSLGADNITVDSHDTANETTGRYGMVGAFVDGFPNPTGGFHLGGALSFATLHLDAKDNSVIQDHNGVGAGVLAWAGYDAWISSEWSLGGQLQFSGAVTRQSKDNVDKVGNVGGVSLLFTSLFH